MISSRSRVNWNGSQVARSCLVAGEFFYQDLSYHDELDWGFQPSSVVIQPNGDVTLVGQIGSNEIVLGRLHSNGDPDPSFGDGAVANDQIGTAVTGSGGADLRGCALSVAGFANSFAIAQYALCCE